MSDEDRIVRVARALRVADGHDPEAEITIGTDVVDEGDGGVRCYEVTVSTWTSYVGEARRMIAAVRAMGLL